jgi:hypothetical protein
MVKEYRQQWVDLEEDETQGKQIDRYMEASEVTYSEDKEQ